MKVGDTLALLLGKDKKAETEALMQILLKKVFKEKTFESLHHMGSVVMVEKLKLSK
jgi:hypothetical protein